MIGKAKKSTKPHKKGAAKAVGKQLGRTKGMFGSFVDEFKKASEEALVRNKERPLLRRADEAGGTPH
jgi:hypothetical protein